MTKVFFYMHASTRAAHTSLIGAATLEGQDRCEQPLVRRFQAPSEELIVHDLRAVLDEGLDTAPVRKTTPC